MTRSGGCCSKCVKQKVATGEMVLLELKRSVEGQWNGKKIDCESPWWPSSRRENQCSRYKWSSPFFKVPAIFPILSLCNYHSLCLVCSYSLQFNCIHLYPQFFWIKLFTVPLCSHETLHIGIIIFCACVWLLHAWYLVHRNVQQYLSN